MWREKKLFEITLSKFYCIRLISKKKNNFILTPLIKKKITENNRYFVPYVL